jgi:hypothetical protein
MNRYSAFHLRLAALYALWGMGLGLYMGISENHSMVAAHAHINLLGWVSITLYGLVLRFDSTLSGLLPLLQTICAHVGTVGMGVGLMLMFGFGLPAIGGPLLGVAAVVMLIGAILFVPMVFRLTRY